MPKNDSPPAGRRTSTWMRLPVCSATTSSDFSASSVGPRFSISTST